MTKKKRVAIGVLLGVLEGAAAPQAVGEVGNVYRLSEILRRRSEIFVIYLYKNALFHMNMSLSGLCTSFGKVTLFSLPKVFCGPQICQKCVCGRGSAPDPAGGAHDAQPDPSRLGRGYPFPFPVPPWTHNSIQKYFVGNLVTAAPLQYPSAIRLCVWSHSYTTWRIIPSFGTRRMFGGGDPFSLKFWVRVTPLERKRRFSIYFRS